MQLSSETFRKFQKLVKIQTIQLKIPCSPLFWNDVPFTNWEFEIQMEFLVV